MHEHLEEPYGLLKLNLLGGAYTHSGNSVGANWLEQKCVIGLHFLLTSFDLMRSLWRNAE